MCQLMMTFMRCGPDTSYVSYDLRYGSRKIRAYSIPMIATVLNIVLRLTGTAFSQFTGGKRMTSPYQRFQEITSPSESRAASFRMPAVLAVKMLPGF